MPFDKEEAQLPSAQPSSLWRSVRRVIFAAAVAILVAALVLLALAFHKTFPPAVETSPAAATQLERQLKAAELSDPIHVLTADQTEVNSLIDSRLQLARSAGEGGGAALHDMKLQIKEDRMHIYVLLNAYGKDMTLDLEGKLFTENGYLHFDPLSGKVGALPIPRSMLQSSMREMMNSPEGRQRLRLPSNVSDVHVEGGKIVATFK